MSALSDLDDSDFRQAMKLAAWKEDRWVAFMDDSIVDRTQEHIRSLLAELEVQRTSTDMDDDPEWAKAVKGLQRRLNARAIQVTAKVREMNRQETATATAYERKWSDFSFALAEQIEGSPADYLLDDTFIPSGELTVREWMSVRRAQKAAKAVRAA